MLQGTTQHFVCSKVLRHQTRPRWPGSQRQTETYTDDRHTQLSTVRENFKSIMDFITITTQFLKAE